MKKQYPGGFGDTGKKLNYNMVRHQRSAVDPTKRFVEIGTWDQLTDKKTIQVRFNKSYIKGTEVVLRSVKGGNPERNIFILYGISHSPLSSRITISAGPSPMPSIGTKVRSSLKVGHPKEKKIYELVEERIAARKNSNRG